MMMRSTSVILIALMVVAIGLGLSVYTVYESERAIITRLGRLKKADDGKVQVFEPGIHWKFPLIDVVHSFDVRLNMTEIPFEQIVAKDKEVLLVKLFIQWHVHDYGLFYNTTYDASDTSEGIESRERAEQLLRKAVKSVLSTELGQQTLQSVVSGAQGLIENLRVRTNESIAPYGMQIVDVRINGVKYPPEVANKVFTRMSGERQIVAAAYRASGESKAAIIRDDADRAERIIIAEAKKDAERLKGEGDSRAFEIYAESYGQSPEFYRFYRSLEAYKTIFRDKSDILVLKPEGDFFSYFQSMGR